MIRIRVFGTGGITSWPIVVAGKKSPDPLAKRGAIHDLSTRSRLRCAWLLSNAPRAWGAMAVLTFRSQPGDPKRALKKFVRAFRRHYGDGIQWAWIMEWQARGVIHFHLFFERPWLDSLGYETETVTRRRGKLTTIVRGDFDEWMQTTWAGATGERHADFRRFQAGGIIELLRTPDAAGRYVAKEAGKRTQKELPAGVECAGRWWWISPTGKPRPTGRIELERWPYEKAYKYVFDVADIVARRFREQPLAITRAARAGEAAPVRGHRPHLLSRESAEPPARTAPLPRAQTGDKHTCPEARHSAAWQA